MNAIDRSQFAYYAEQLSRHLRDLQSEEAGTTGASPRIVNSDSRVATPDPKSFISKRLFVIKNPKATF